MDDGKLIDAIRRHEVLFDPSHFSYTDAAFKKQIWKEIADELNTNVYACKSRWSNIRDTYRKSLKKGAEKCIKKRKKYKFANKLAFMNKYLMDKKPNAEEEDEEELEGRVRIDANMIKSDPEGLDLLRDEDSQSRSSVLPMQDSEVIEGPPDTLKRPTRTKCSLPQSGSAVEIVDYLMNKTDCQVFASQHPVDTFLAGISMTLKTFSPYHLNLAKSEIFATVQKYELRSIMGDD